MPRRRRKIRLGDATQERLHRRAQAAAEAAREARRLTNCTSARRTLEEAEGYYGEAVLDATDAPRLTLDVRQALSFAMRELGKTRERLDLKCGVPDDDSED